MNSKARHLPSPFALVLAVGVSLASGALVSADRLENRSSSAEQKTTHAASEPVREGAIASAIESYVRAKYAGDVEGIQSRAHHDIARRARSDTYWGQPSTEWVRTMHWDDFRHLGTEMNRAKRDDPENGRCDIEVFDIEQFTAAARVITDDTIEYLHMMLFDGRWVIADASVIPLPSVGATPPAVSKKHTEAVRRVVHDYCMGFYELDGKKVQGTCHPSLSKRTVDTAEHGGFNTMQSISWEEIGLLGEHFNRHWGFDPETARCEIEVYEIRRGVAIAKLTGTVWFDYFQLMEINGEWSIVNIMYESLDRSRWSNT